MTDTLNHPDVAFIEDIYLEHCRTRFRSAALSGELPLKTLSAARRAIEEDDRVTLEPKCMKVDVGEKTHEWCLAGMNAEYLVQLAYVARLRQALGNSPAMIKVEWRQADIVVLQPGDGAPLLHVEVKTKRSGTVTEKREAQQVDSNGKPIKPAAKRVAQVDAARVLFGYADMENSGDANVMWWAEVRDGRIHEEPTPCTWDDVDAFLSGAVGR